MSVLGVGEFCIFVENKTKPVYYMTPKQYVKSHLEYAECLRVVTRGNNSFLPSTTYKIINVGNSKVITEAKYAKKAWQEANGVIEILGLKLCV